MGWEDPLEKEMATQSSIPAWRIPRAEEPAGPWDLILLQFREELVHRRGIGRPEFKVRNYCPPLTNY